MHKGNISVMKKKGQKAYNKNLILPICFSHNCILKICVSPVNAPFASSLQLEQIGKHPET